MAMSWVAPASAMTRAKTPTTHGVSGCPPTPARPSVAMKRTIWEITVHPRLRPSLGGTKRSISGDQRNLKVQGACARVNRPTIRMSTPMSRIQSGIASQTRPSGMPEEMDISDTEAVRQEVKACLMLRKVPGRFALGSWLKAWSPAGHAGPTAGAYMGSGRAAPHPPPPPPPPPHPPPPPPPHAPTPPRELTWVRRAPPPPPPSPTHPPSARERGRHLPRMPESTLKWTLSPSPGRGGGGVGEGGQGGEGPRGPAVRGGGGGCVGGGDQGGEVPCASTAAFLQPLHPRPQPGQPFGDLFQI